jgi:hypothetical protein
MSKNILGLEIEIRKTKNQNDFRFNETMVQAVLAGLSVVYDEVFIWSVNNHLGVLTTEGSPEFLYHTFTHHHSYFKKMEVMSNYQAKKFIDNACAGTIWKDCSKPAKLNSFQYAYDLSITENCVKEVLRPILESGLTALQENPIITSAQNSWHKMEDESEGDTIAQLRIKSPNLFYRFCIN